MADKPKAAPSKPATTTPADTSVSDREAELKRQQAVVDAVHDATHDANGDPKPLGGNPPGITLVEGKP